MAYLLSPYLSDKYRQLSKPGIAETGRWMTFVLRLTYDCSETLGTS